MTEFLANLTQYGDMPGLGLYEIGHYRQHRDYAAHLAQTNNIFIPDYPVMHLVFDTDSQLADWLNLHEMLHGILRGHAGFYGPDLSELDPKSPASWDNWQEYHRFEHSAFDQLFRMPA
jgi:uncharacterized membrane protein YccC